jgi:archaellum component FlaF (FlaF/FlaG flagellin family)
MIFGIIAVASLIFGGIQYSASAGDPQNVAKAKKRIIDTIIAIVAYFFLYMFIQFLVPGGAF